MNVSSGRANINKYLYIVNCTSQCMELWRDVGACGGSRTWMSWTIDHAEEQHMGHMGATHMKWLFRTNFDCGDMEESDRGVLWHCCDHFNNPSNAGSHDRSPGHRALSFRRKISAQLSSDWSDEESGELSLADTGNSITVTRGRGKKSVNIVKRWHHESWNPRQPDGNANDKYLINLY